MAKGSGSAGRNNRSRATTPPMSPNGTVRRSLPDATRVQKAKRRAPDKGRVTEAYGADPTQKYKVRYELRELGDLVTSNTDSGAVNPAYPEELQPRDRTRAASRMQVERMAQNLVPEAYATEFRSLDRGAPIVGVDNVVESGNGRTMALRRAVESNPEGYQAYKENLKRTAREKGIDPNAVGQYKNPVLVRVRVDKVDRVKFAREANTASILGMSDTEKSKSDSSRISTRDLLQFDSSGEDINADLRKSSNRDFIRSFVANLPEGERATVIDRKGELTQSGQQRIKGAMFTRVYDDTRLSDRIFESTDDDTKNISNGLMASLGKLAQAEEKVKTGQRDKDLSIAGDITAATKVYVRLKEEKTPVDHYLNQKSMFGDELNSGQKKILVELDRRHRSGKQIAEFIGTWVDIVENEPDPNQISMFGPARRSKDELIDYWISSAGRKQPQPQQSLF